MADAKMVVVDGVRYREEDAPKVESKATEPKNKARKPANKSASGSASEE